MKINVNIDDMTMEEAITYVDAQNICEMDKLSRLLDSFEIPFSFKRNGIGCTYNYESYSIICDKYSYGHEEGLLEMYNYEWEDAMGWLTAIEVFNIILKEGECYNEF